MSSATDLKMIADEILDAAVEALDTIPVSAPGLEGAPGRAFVSPGEGSIDCCDDGQLSVYVSAISDAPLAPGLKQGRLEAGKKIHVAVTLIIARCIPDNRGLMVEIADPPLTTDLEAVAAQTYADIWALENCLYGMWRSGELFTLCGEVFFEGARPFMEGGCAGWRLTIRFTLDGYECVPST